MYFVQQSLPKWSYCANLFFLSYFFPMYLKKTMMNTNSVYIIQKLVKIILENNPLYVVFAQFLYNNFKLFYQNMFNDYCFCYNYIAVNGLNTINCEQTNSFRPLI